MVDVARLDRELQGQPWRPLTVVHTGAQTVEFPWASAGLSVLSQ